MRFNIIFLTEETIEETKEISTVAPTKSEADKIGEMTQQIAEEIGIPTWGLVAIIIGEFFFVFHTKNYFLFFFFCFFSH